jgi:hypothetical protein
MSIFDLAGLELQRENKDPNNISDLLNRAITIRKYLDIQSRNKKVLKSRYTKKEHK